MVARRSSATLMRRPDRRRSGSARRGPAVLAAAACALAVLAATRPVRRVEVAGTSMAPALLPGDRLVVLRPPVGRRWPPPGTVVAVRDPRVPARVLVKRVASVDRDAGTVEVLGDAAGGSTDSRTFGPVPRSAVVGRAVYRYAPAGRTGRGPWSTEYARR